jgi:hypothetical protein
MSSATAGTIQDVFEECSEIANRFAAEIREGLGREPDTGDALLGLACITDSIAGQALHEVGVDVSVLERTIQRLRREAYANRQELTRRLEATRISEERAVEAQEFSAAAELRDEQRELARRLRGSGSVHPGALHTIRRHLGIASVQNVR